MELGAAGLHVVGAAGVELLQVVELLASTWSTVSASSCRPVATRPSCWLAAGLHLVAGVGVELLHSIAAELLSVVAWPSWW